MKNKKIKEWIMEAGFVLVSNLIVALGVTFFILPSDILSGGTAGIAVALEPILHLPETLVINVLTVGLFLLGSICLGKAFFLKTVLSTLVYPVYISVLSLYFSDMVITDNQLLASIYAGICIGVGIGLVYRVDGSTGGMDIPPLIVHKYTHLPLSVLVMCFDGATVLLGAAVYGIEASMIGLVSVFISGQVINKVLTLGSEASKTLFIISPKWEEIRDAINQELDRGVTLVPALGGYANEQRMMVMTVVKQKQFANLQRLITHIDPEAFFVVNDANEVQGAGFTFGKHYRSDRVLTQAQTKETA